MITGTHQNVCCPSSLINSLLGSLMHVQNIDLFQLLLSYCRRVANWATSPWPASPWWPHHPWGTTCHPCHPMASPSIRPTCIPTSLHGRPFAISHSIVILIVPDIIISLMRWVVTTIEILFSSNRNIHKSSSGHCFWASDPLINWLY